MSSQWSMLNQAEKNDSLDYNVYRCPDPVAVTTGEPWYPISNVCPCNPNLSGTTGRGFTACPFGLTIEKPGKPYPLGQLIGQIPKNSQIVGSLYNQDQYVPTQLDPRPLSKIGYQWRSAN